MSITKKLLLALIGKRATEALVAFECRIARSWASSAHHRLMIVQWGLPPQPEHFDHHIDLFYLWLEKRSSFWLERGVFGGLSLKGGDVLELACGDGFNARNFYSGRSNQVVACDFDLAAINTARAKNSAPNVTFVLADIRHAMPAGTFANVIWDAAIEHFSLDETAKILTDIKARLTNDGVLSGYTLVERKDGKKSLTHHEYEFKGKKDLLAILAPHFANVVVFETEHPQRHNLYFWASDGDIPFMPEWRGGVTKLAGASK